MSKFVIKANVYAIKHGPTFGKTVYNTIEAENDERANFLGQIKFQRYCITLERHHNTEFAFNNFEFKEYEN